MDDVRIGAALRAVRLRQRWRQQDLADRAGVSSSLISLIERGHMRTTSLDTLRRIAAALEMRLDVIVRWRGGELDRLLNARHSALHEAVARRLLRYPGWTLVPEVSFSIYGERGVIDILAFHADSGSLLVIELKTAIVDVNELVGTLDRKARLAPRIAQDRGWQARSVSRWLIVSRDSTNLRRVRAHRSMLRAAFPADGHQIRSWLGQPVGAVNAMSLWSSAIPRGVRRDGGRQIRPGRASARS